jgi:hypothetical protein
MIAISADRGLTAVNIPWVFRLPADTPVADALRCFTDAAGKSGANRGRVRETLASGALVGGKVRFDPKGDPR